MQRKVDPNEDLLIEKAIKGDEAAFAALILPYRGKIYHLCLGIVRDQEIAEDMVQEAFLHAYAHLKDFRGEAKFYTWLYKIAKNLCLNTLKKRGKQQEKEKRIIIEPEYINIKKRIGKFKMGEKVEEDELAEAIHKACEKLPAHQKVVFEKFILEGKRHTEIAKELNLPQGTVRSRLFYARKKVQEILSVNNLLE